MNNPFKFNWVLVDELSIGTPPKNLDDIEILSKKGIKSILRLCSLEESKNKNIEQKLIKEFNYQYSILPDHKSGRAPSTRELKDSLNKLILLKNNGPVFVHCFAAVERSPLLCMAYLIKFMKLDLSQSLEYLKRVNETTNPLNNQLEVLKDL